MRYGQRTLKAVRDYEKNLNRFNKVSLDIGFLQKCQLFHICPNFLHFKLSRREFQDTPACRRFKKDLLKFPSEALAALNLFFLTKIDLAVAKWLRLYINLPVGTAMIFISEKQKDDCMTEKLNILKH